MGMMAAIIGGSIAVSWVMVKLIDLGLHPAWVMFGLFALAILAAGFV